MVVREFDRNGGCNPHPNQPESVTNTNNESLYRDGLWREYVIFRDGVTRGQFGLLVPLEGKEGPLVGVDEDGKPFFKYGADESGYPPRQTVAFGEPMPLCKTLRSKLGVKGEGLYRMTLYGLPVPPGFTLLTDACVTYFETGRIDRFKDEFWRQLEDLERRTGKKLGDPQNPLFVSVRSGAAVSLPGLLTTILNVGINDQTIGALEREIGVDPAWEAYFSLVKKFGTAVYGIKTDEFDAIDKNLSGKERVKAAKEVIKSHSLTFPEDPHIQLDLPLLAVFNSAKKDEAIKELIKKNPRLDVLLTAVREAYEQEGREIPGSLFAQLSQIKEPLKRRSAFESIATAVNVVEMCWGNKKVAGQKPFSAVMFTTDPTSGEDPRIIPAFGAQGEAVVGTDIAQSKSLDELPVSEEIKNQLKMFCFLLERYFGNPLEVELVYDGEKLWFLQVRKANLSPLARFRFLYSQVVSPSIPDELFLSIFNSVECPWLINDIKRRIESGEISPTEALGEILFFQICLRNQKFFGQFPIEILRKIEEGRINVDDPNLLSKISTETLRSLLIPPLDPIEVEKAISEGRLLAQGESLNTGYASGTIVRSYKVSEQEQEVILVTDNIEELRDAVLPKSVKAVLSKNGSVGSHAARYAERWGIPVILGIGEGVNKLTVGLKVTVEESSGRIFSGSIPTQKDGQVKELTPEEINCLRLWLELKTENPFLYSLMGEREPMGEEIKAMADLAKEATRMGKSLKACEYLALNAVIPSYMRESYEVLSREDFINNKEVIRRKLQDIIQRGNHASIRTCHHPQRPRGGPWVLITSMADIESFLTDPNFQKGKGLENLVSDSQLTEILIGEFPAGKLDPEKAQNHCVWTLTISESGELKITIFPFTAQLRRLETADLSQTVTININPYSSDFATQIQTYLGEKLADLGEEEFTKLEDFVFRVFTTLMGWIDEGLLLSLASLQEVFPRFTEGSRPNHGIIVLEGQAGLDWVKIYGIKADYVGNNDNPGS